MRGGGQEEVPVEIVKRVEAESVKEVPMEVVEEATFL